jgi:hypothetical protein
MSQVRAGDPTLFHFVRPWRAPLIIGAILILADQMLQMLVTVWPIDLAVPISRFQTAALFTGRMAAIAILGLMLLFAAETAARPAWVKAIGVFALLVWALLLGCLAVLWIDGPRVKTSVPGQQVSPFMAQWFRGLVVSVVGSIGFGALGIRLITR